MHQDVAKAHFSTILLRLPQSDPPCQLHPLHEPTSSLDIPPTRPNFFRPSFMRLPPSVRSPWSNHTHVRGLLNAKDPGSFLPIIQDSIAGIPTLAGISQ